MTEQQQTIILVIDDEPTDLFPIERVFSKLSPKFVLKSVQTGEEAISYLQGKAPYSDRAQSPLPDLILLDIRLPAMSGLDFLSWLRNQPEFKDLPVITLTSYGNRDLKHAYERGADFYLLKPIDLESVVDILRALGLDSEDDSPTP